MAKIKIKPICECGYIFDKIYVTKHVEDIGGQFAVMGTTFEPSACPNCKRKIESVSFDTLIVESKLDAEIGGTKNEYV